MKPPPDRSLSQETAGQSAKQVKQKALQTGQLAETLVAQWLTLQGWTVLHQRWHCPYGELDIIATRLDTLVFVEVKARSKGNWDANGLLSVTPRKQAKLWHAAQLFLADSPHLAAFSCRFDVAVLSCKPVRSSGTESPQPQLSLPLAIASRFPQKGIEIGQPIVFEGYELTLQQYIPNAFSEI